MSAKHDERAFRIIRNTLSLWRGKKSSEVAEAVLDDLAEVGLSVRAENSHEALVGALERARPFLNYIEHSQDWQEAREQVDAALARARGETP